MRFANELKVGLAIVVSAVIFLLGYRYLQDVPLLSGTTTYYAFLKDAEGLIAGNPVRLKGVKVGSVAGVRYNPDTDSIRVDFKVSRDIRVYEGSGVDIAGIDALGGVRLELELGPDSNPVIRPGGRVGRSGGSDFLTNLTARAPELVDRTDSVLAGLDETLASVTGMLNDPGSDLRQSLSSLRATAATLERTLEGESESISNLLRNLEQITGSVNEAVGGEDDSLAVAVADLRASLASLKSMTSSLEETTGRLDRITAKIDSGEGTLGMLVNDPGLYVQLDSAAMNLNALLADFRAHPRRYLRELKLVDIF